MDKSKLYMWRKAIFHAHLHKGNFESIVFYFHPSYMPSENIRKSIVSQGGFVINDPLKDSFTLILVNTKIENYKEDDSQFKDSYDLFDCTFVEQCIEKKKLENLNSFRIGETIFEEYDANEVLSRRLKWSSISKKQKASIDGITTTTCSANVNIANCSKDPATSKATKQCEIVNKANPKKPTETSGSCKPQEHLVRRLRSRIREKTPIESPKVVFKEPETPSCSSKSTTPESIVNKKIVSSRVANDSHDTPSSSKQIKSHLNRPTKLNLHISPKPKSLSLAGGVENLRSSHRELIPVSQSNLNLGNEKAKAGPVTHNKSEPVAVVPQKSSSSSKSSKKSLSSHTEPNNSPSKSTRSHTLASTSSTAKPSNSKSPEGAASKPATSTGSKTAESVTSKYFKSLSKPQQRQKTIAVPSKRSVLDATSTPYQSLWLSALRDSDGSESPTKEKEVQKKRRYMEEEDTRSVRSISPIESLSGDDFDRRSVFSSVSSKTTGRRPYSEKEKNTILTFVCENNYHQYIHGNKIWQELETKKSVPERTWQSLREHFNKQMFPNIMNNRKLSDRDKKKFERAIKIIKLGKREEAPI